MREGGSKSRCASCNMAARCVTSDGFIGAPLNLSSAYLGPEERYIPQLYLPPFILSLSSILLSPFTHNCFVF